MSVASDIVKLETMLRQLKPLVVKPKFKRGRGGPNWGRTRDWVLKNITTTPIRTTDFYHKGMMAGFGKASLYQATIRLIDEKVIGEDRFRHEIWKANGRKVWRGGSQLVR